MYLEKIMNVRENIKDTVIKIPLLYSNVFLVKLVIIMYIWNVKTYN